jgi:hypothetical protein
MKTLISAFNRPWTILLALLGLTLVSWSPSGTDYVVSIGSGNTTTGYRGVISGTNNTVGSANKYSIITGESNVGNVSGSIIVGAQNTVANTANNAADCLRFSGIFGSYNQIPNTKASILVAGYSNTVKASSSLVSGSLNYLEAPANETCNYSAAIGLSNSVNSAAGWAIGWANAAYGTKSTAIGEGTKALNEGSTALGRYNADMGAGDVLVVGAGSDFNNRSTALRVTNDGGVLLGRAQGDISMGDYQ